jgi:hypothetical protein
MVLVHSRLSVSGSLGGGTGSYEGWSMILAFMSTGSFLDKVSLAKLPSQ